MILSNRSSQFTDSVIRRMTRISDSCGAINLAQGFPDFDPPEALMKRLQEVAWEGPHQYSVTWGAPNFREALAKKQSFFMEMDIDPEREIVVTCGSTEAMMASMLAVTNPGDKVVVFSPFYENYAADAILSGAEPIFVSLKEPEFVFDPNELEEAFKLKPKALILCNPSNPSGKVFTYEELKVIADLAIKYNVFVITDEVYEHILYKPHKHIYMATLPGMRDRTISCGSLSKTYSITGWRLGYVIASPYIIEKIRNVHDFLTVGAAAPLQEAAMAGLEFPLEYYNHLEKEYHRKKDLMHEGLSALKIPHTDPQGAYYVLLDIYSFGYENDYEFCKDLTTKVGVAAVPGSSFFRENIQKYARIHFAKRDSTIIRVLEKLEDIYLLKK